MSNVIAVTKQKAVGKGKSAREGKRGVMPVCAWGWQPQLAAPAARLQQRVKQNKKAQRVGRVPGERDLVSLGCLRR